MAAGLPKPRPLYRCLGKFLTSRKVGVVLLLAVLLVLWLGLWLPQVPRDLDTAGQEDWWAAAEARYGEKLAVYTW